MGQAQISGNWGYAGQHCDGEAASRYTCLPDCGSSAAVCGALFHFRAKNTSNLCFTTA